MRNNMSINVFGYRKGMKLGPDLCKMTDQEIDEIKLTRAVMLRVSGKLYKNLEFLSGSPPFTWKI